VEYAKARPERSGPPRGALPVPDDTPWAAKRTPKKP
jgi:hypothetical protein